MARKLNPEEEHILAQAWSAADAMGSDSITDSFLRQLAEKRDASLNLAPDLNFWFAKDVSGRLLP